MPSKEQLAAFSEVFVTASIIGVGWALGGTVGAAVMAGIGINLGSDILKNGSKYLKERWLSAENGVLNHDIQRALVRAFIKALVRLETRYFELPEASAQPREKKKAIRELFKELREVAPPTFAASLERIATEQKIKEYLYGEPLAARNTLWEHVEGTELLYTYYGDHFKTFLRNNMNDELVFCFGEELKTDSPDCNKAWRAFQRMLLEGIQSEVKTLQANHEAIREDLIKLRTIQTRLDEIKDIIDHRTPNEPFTRGLENGLGNISLLLESVIKTTHRTGSQVDIVVATTERTETKLDTVGRTLVDEGKKIRRKIAKVGSDLQTSVQDSVQQILQGLAAGQPSQFSSGSLNVDLKKGGDRAKRRRNHTDRIRVYAQTVVRALVGFERLGLSVKIKAKLDSQQAALTNLLEEHNRLVITAGRGAGKTAFMKQILRSLCVTLLDELGVRKSQVDSLLVPAYIELDQLYSDRTNVPYREGDLLRLLVDNLGYLGEEHPERVLEELLDRFKIVLLLDGLNELPSPDQSACRNELFRLDQALTSGGRGHKLRIVLTSRSLGFAKHADEFRKRGWETAEVLPLELDEIKSELAQSLGYEVGQNVFRRLDPKRRQILSTPQNLDHFIKWCHHQLEESSANGIRFNVIEEKIVREPAGTFLKYQVDMLLDTLHNKDTAFVEEILSHLAYETVRVGTSFPYSRVEPEFGSSLQPASRDALSVLTEILHAKHSKIDPEALLSTISKSGILIIIQSRNLCRFENQSFQEYFAACKMRRLWKLDEYLSDARWREPLAVMAGLLERDQLLELLRKIRHDPQLYAYILAHVHESKIEREFQMEQIEQFVHKIEQWATRIAWSLRFLFGMWFLSIPAVAYFLSEVAVFSLKSQLLFSCLGIGYFFAFPLALIRWNDNQFRSKQERLKKYELRNLITILRILQARQAMELVLEKLRKLESRWRDLEFQEEDPRRAFVKQAMANVRGAVSAPAFYTEDELLDHLSDPLVAASIDLGVLSTKGIESLYEKALNPADDPTGLEAMDKLAELYATDSECHERVAQVFRAMVLNTDRRYSRRRVKHASDVCQKLQITLGRTPRQRLNIIAPVLAFLKRVWYTLKLH